VAHHLRVNPQVAELARSLSVSARGTRFSCEVTELREILGPVSKRIRQPHPRRASRCEAISLAHTAAI
jgi:hypothetical protein